MLKEVAACAAVNRDVGGSDREISLVTKASFGFMAQNKNDAVQHHHDMRWATSTKMMDTTQKMIDVNMKLADSMVGNGMGDELRMSILKMMEKIEKWNEELELMMEEKRESMSIVGRVLEHTTRSMRLTAHLRIGLILWILSTRDWKYLQRRLLIRKMMTIIL